MSWKRRSAGSPPTLWWVLIFWAAFDLGRRRLDDVRVERALGQEVDPAELGGLLLEDPDELVADDLALLLRVLDAGQAGEEALARIDHDQVHPEVALEGDPEELRFLLAHQAVVHVDAGQPIADRPMDEGRRDRRVDAARQRADDEPVRAGRRGVGVDPVADVGDGRVDEVAGGPGRRDAGDVHDEVAQDVLAARRVDDLGVELDAVQVARGVDEAGVRRGVGLGGRAEAVRQPRDRVGVAHPDRLLAVEAGEQRVVGGDADVGRTVLAVVERDDVATELVGHQLGAVADAEDRDLAGPDGRIGARGALVVDRVRAAGQDDRAGPAPLELGVRRVVREELGVDVELADAPGDELGELAAEVEDDDGLAVLGVGGGRVGRPASDPGRRRSARSRGRPRPPRRPGRGPDGRRWRPRRGRSCRASVRPWMTRRVVRQCRPPLAVSPARRQCTGRHGTGPGRDGRGQSRLRIASAAIAM